MVTLAKRRGRRHGFNTEQRSHGEVNVFSLFLCGLVSPCSIRVFVNPHRFHRSFAPGVIARLLPTSRLLVYDEAYYRRWLERARQIVGSRRGSRRIVLRIASAYDCAIDRLVAMPRTLIHGEFYPCNVVVRTAGRRVRVCPVDWEMAAYAPALVDLASLATGWNSRAQRAIVRAYHTAMSGGVSTTGIPDEFRCHEQGVVTSASLMVNWPWAAAAAEYARRTPALSVGLHFDLGEWVFRNGEWTSLYQIVQPDDPSAIEQELVRQLERFRRLMRCDPTHIDSHQHVHQHQPVNLIVRTLGDRLGVSCRGLSDLVSYHGEFYGQTGDGQPLEGAITLERLTTILSALPVETIELGCHPDLRGDAPGMYVGERGAEARVLCDARLRAAIAAQGIQLISFHDLRQHASARPAPA